MKQEGTYIGAEGKLASYDIHYDENKKLPIILFCHGFKGFKDWGTFDLMAKYFAQHEFQFLKINFSHNGTSPEFPSDFVDLEAFGNNNFEKELYDIELLIKQLKSESFATQLDFDKLYLMGHSKGGATALAYTLSHSKIISCATLAGVIDPIRHYGKIHEKIWKEKGVKFVLNGRTNQKMPIYYQLAENTQKIKDKLNLRKLIKTDPRNFLFLHGTSDEAIPVSELDLVKNLSNCNVKIFENANHVFGASHPYQAQELPDDFEKAIIQIRDFFKLS